MFVVSVSVCVMCLFQCLLCLFQCVLCVCFSVCYVSVSVFVVVGVATMTSMGRVSDDDVHRLLYCHRTLLHRPLADVRLR